MQQEITQQNLSEAYQPLFDLMAETYDRILLKSEMDEIIDAVDKVNENLNELYRDVCDVEGCDIESDNGGSQWRDKGYWRLCSKHWDDGHKGGSYPQMKQGAISREKSRLPDGMLTP